MIYLLQMVIFHSYVNVYQRVTQLVAGLEHEFYFPQ